MPRNIAKIKQNQTLILVKMFYNFWCFYFNNLLSTVVNSRFLFEAQSLDCLRICYLSKARRTIPTGLHCDNWRHTSLSMPSFTSVFINTFYPEIYGSKQPFLRTEKTSLLVILFILTSVERIRENQSYSCKPRWILVRGCFQSRIQTPLQHG